MYLINLLDKAVYNSKNKKIRKMDILNSLQQHAGSQDIDNVEANFCGYNLTQCYGPPKPCLGCNSGGGSKHKKNKKYKKYKKYKINKTKFSNYIKHLVYKRYPGYKITFHSVNLLHSLYNN
jgi:hypothetical protein